MKAATIYERGGKMFIHGSSKTTAGVWVLCAPVLQAENRDARNIGQAVRECLASSRLGVPHPKTFTNLFEPVLKLAGVKSFYAFMNSAKYVGVELEDEVVTLIPTRNGGKDGFIPLPNRSRVALVSDEELGLAIVSALSVAT
jgi:hypothetical protein